MPNYLYQVILEDEIEGPIFEYRQSINDPVLQYHPVTGHAVKRVITAPYLQTQYTPGSERKKLDNKNLEEKGFLKYERDKLTGSYHKVAGKGGPQVIRRD